MNIRDILTREEAIRRLKLIIGKDLRIFAKKFGINIFANGHLNKGWAGDTLERYLGLEKNNNQAPNGRYFELKQISLKKLKNGEIVPKETMQITMINPNERLKSGFLESHAYKKLKSLLLCAILYSSPGGETKLCRVDTLDVDKHEVFDQLKKDYELIAKSLNNKGFKSLKSEMGYYIQPRTKGPGHGSVSRAFYARTRLLKKILSL